MARDNFNKPVIEKLKYRVAHRCSNPTCRVPTSAPSGDEGVNNIGVAAHICAASPGGPRFKQSMSVAERKSINNAIWLCSNCSIDIDRDVQFFTVDLLKEWKIKAENLARAELGNKLPSDGDTINTVAAALTGFPKNYIANAIKNVHEATEKTLEALDPRFMIKTEHFNGMTSFEVHPKEDVSLKMKINGENSKEYIEKYRLLEEHGKDFKINSDAITIEGSKLFDEILGSKNGFINISSKKLKATQKLWLVQKDTNIIEVFDDVHGHISIGTKSISFKGSACNQIFNLTCKKFFNGSDTEGKMTISLCYKQWEGVSLKYLPYFNKVLSLFSKMAQGWEVFTSLEVNGIEVLKSGGAKFDTWDYVLDTSTILQYVQRCKIISDEFKYNLNYPSTFSFTADEHKYIVDIVEVIEGEQVYKEGDITSNAECEMVVGKECKNIKLLQEINEPTSMKMIQNTTEKIELLSVEVELPAKTISVESILPKVHAEVDQLNEGDIVKVEWIPQDDFYCKISYEGK